MGRTGKAILNASAFVYLLHLTCAKHKSFCGDTASRVIGFVYIYIAIVKLFSSRPQNQGLLCLNPNQLDSLA